jgi:hypothetical protein
LLNRPCPEMSSRPIFSFLAYDASTIFTTLEWAARLCSLTACV